MTIILAMKEADDSVLFAADSRQTESLGLVTTGAGKVECHKSLPLAWAMSGAYMESTAELTRQLHAIPSWPPQDWKSFTDTLAMQVAQFNGESRQRAQAARVQADDNHLFSVLFVCWIGNALHILEVDDQGRATPYEREEFKALGSSGAIVQVAGWALNQAAGGSSRLDRIHQMLDLAIAHDTQCGAPKRIYRLKPGGPAEELTTSGPVQIRADTGESA